MKKLLLVLSVVAMASFLFVGCLPGVTPVDEVVTIAAIPGVTAPVTGATPVTAITATSQYTGVVTWLPADTTFAAETVYTATITLTPVTGFILTGVAVDFFTVAGATATNPIDSGVVTAVFPATVAAPVTPVAPTITAIPDAIVAWDGAPWTYQVEWTVGTGTITGFSLAGEPATMTISATGLITWTNIAPAPAVYAVTVTMVTTDGSDTEAFVITVEEPIPPVVEPLIVTIEYDPSYNDGTTTFVRGSDGDCVDVTVTLSEPVEGISIVWTPEGGDSLLIPLVASDATNMIFEEELCFANLEDCKIVCIEVYKTLEEWCPACVEKELIAIDVITVDSLSPCASFIVTFDLCDMPDCPPFPDPANFMSWTSICGAECAIPLDCCDDDCSGVGDWSFTLDFFDKLCGSPCDVFEDYGCEIAGEFALGCDCLLCADPEAEVTGEHMVEVSIMDNVGNEFTDIWYINFDTDCAITFTTKSGIVPTINEDGDYVVDYECGWDDCVDCGLL